MHQRTTVSDFTLAMIARHVRNGGLAWIGAAVAPECPESGADVLAGDDDAWSLSTTTSPDELRAGLDELSAALADSIDRADLDAIVPKPHALWFPEDLEGWQARWVSVQTIAEIARHAGHADIIREALEGKKSYELNDRSDGVLADDGEYVAWG